MNINGIFKPKNVLKGKILALPLIDKTLTQKNKAADAKATGDAIADVKKIALDGHNENSIAISKERTERKKEISVERARIDNIVTNNNDTEGNAELIDVRVGANGFVYDSAGEAVRSQTTDLNDRISAIDGGREPVTPQWESGSFNATADGVSYVNNANRIHTPQDKPIPLKKGDKFELPKTPGISDYQYSLYWYSLDDAYHYVSTTLYDVPYEVTEDGDYFISLRRVDGTLVASADDITFNLVQGENKIENLENDVAELNEKVDTEVDALKNRMSALDGNVEETPIEWTLGKQYLLSNGVLTTGNQKSSGIAEIVMSTGDTITNKDVSKGRIRIYYDLNGTMQEIQLQSTGAVFFADADRTYYIRANQSSTNDASVEEIETFFELTRSDSGGGIISNLEENYVTYQVPEYVKGVFNAKYKDFDENSATKTQDIYDWYDELTFAHSSSMTKEQYGTSQTPEGVCTVADPNTYPMYAYTISPLKFAKHKILLAYGIHGNGSGGDAIQGVIGLAYFIKDLLNNYLKHPTMKYIREYCTVVVMPILNPWGYQNNSRGNGRNIDLNRNFGVGFTRNESASNDLAYFQGSPIRTGDSAFSEEESQNIRDYISQNHTDALFMLEGHSRGKSDKLLNRFQTYVADVDMSTEQANAINKSSKRLVEKYGGSYVGTTSSEAKGQCFRYFRDTFNIFAYENEAFGRYVLPIDSTTDEKLATMSKTDGTDLTQIQATDFVASTVLAVAESFGLTPK